MDFYVPRSKKEIVDWLFWFYSGKYTKAEIKRKDVRGWYFKLRLSGAVKTEKNNPLHKASFSI